MTLRSKINRPRKLRIRIRYADLGVTPPDYKCDFCAETGVKLWRNHGTSAVELYCFFCALEDMGSAFADDAAHRYGKFTGLHELVFRCMGGDKAPAVPDEDDMTWRTGLSAPGAEWWLSLPTVKRKARP